MLGSPRQAGFAKLPPSLSALADRPARQFTLSEVEVPRLRYFFALAILLGIAEHFKIT